MKLYNTDYKVLKSQEREQRGIIDEESKYSGYGIRLSFRSKRN